MSRTPLATKISRCRDGTPRSLAPRIAGAVAKAHGFEPRVLVLGGAALAQAVAGNPFPRAVPSAANLAALERVRQGKEAFALQGSVLYLHTPAGFNTSRLAASAERLLKVDATARNWTTVTRLLQMLAD